MGFGLRASLITIGVMSLLYFALSPFVYFRHDDWLMLGNSLFVGPQGFSFIWEPFWYTSPAHKEVWFFRPLFKSSIWLGFNLFKYDIWFWMLAHWFFILGSAFFAERSLMSLKVGTYNPYLFFLCFLSSLSIHFANVVWVGEGMMNTPQLFFLSMTAFMFISSSRFIQLASLFPFLISLGFKESSAFLPLFLAAISWRENLVSRRTIPLILYFCVMTFYLIYRLGYLPFNPGYKPTVHAWEFIKPAAYFFMIIVFPFIWLIIQALTSQQSFKNPMKGLPLFIIFLIALIAPHLGHPFFSPGWVLLPGFFTIWTVCYFFPIKLTTSQTIRNLLFILITSTSIVGFQTWSLRWFNWGKIQKNLHSFIQKADPNLINELYVRNCQSKQHSGITFERVVGAKGNLEFMWLLEHNKKIDVHFVPCDFKGESKNSRAMITWNFPQIEFN